MNFLSLIRVELQKIRRSKILLIMIVATIILCGRSSFRRKHANWLGVFIKGAWHRCSRKYSS